MKPIRIIFETENKEYRILEYADEFVDISDLKGDVYNPKVNPDIDQDQLKKEEFEFEELVNREGVFGYVLEKWDSAIGVGYEQVDACWGFVGQYTPTDSKFNHYIVDELKGQIPKKQRK